MAPSVPERHRIPLQQELARKAWDLREPRPCSLVDQDLGLLSIEPSVVCPTPEIELVTKAHEVGRPIDVALPQPTSRPIQGWGNQGTHIDLHPNMLADLRLNLCVKISP